MIWPFTKQKTTPDIKTSRLRLVPITPEMMTAESQPAEALPPLLHARLTPEWPPEHWEPHVLSIISTQLTDQPETAGFHRYIVLPDSYGCGRTLIGCTGAFPRPDGDVEIGYSTLPAFQRQGYGTEAVTALVDWLLTRKGVLSVSAQTYPTLPESIKIMERVGMSPAGPGDDPGTLRYRRTR